MVRDESSRGYRISDCSKGEVMRRIYPLSDEVPFVDLADAFRQSQLELAEVVSCTFPGRPEPRSARWDTALGAACLRYEYLPDIELRYLHVLTPDFSLLADGAGGVGVEPFLEAQLGGAWFEGWDSLRVALMRGDHAPSNRAAAAFSVAAKYNDDSFDGHAALLEALRTAAGRGKIAAAEHIIAVVKAEDRAIIELAYDDADNVELRVHLKRARDRVDRLTL